MVVTLAEAREISVSLLSVSYALSTWESPQKLRWPFPSLLEVLSSSVLRRSCHFSCGIYWHLMQICLSSWPILLHQDSRGDTD